MNVSPCLITLTLRTCIFSLIFSNTTAFANDTTSHNTAGIKLFKAKQYEEAILEFREAINSAIDSKDKLTALENICLPYEAMQKTSELWQAKHDAWQIRHDTQNIPIPDEFNATSMEDAAKKQQEKKASEESAKLQKEKEQSQKLQLAAKEKSQTLLLASKERRESEPKHLAFICSIQTPIPSAEIMDEYGLSGYTSHALWSEKTIQGLKLQKKLMVDEKGTPNPNVSEKAVYVGLLDKLKDCSNQLHEGAVSCFSGVKASMPAMIGAPLNSTWGEALYLCKHAYLSRRYFVEPDDPKLEQIYKLFTEIYYKARG